MPARSGKTTFEVITSSFIAMRSVLTLLLPVLFLSLLHAQEQNLRPRIGLTLSGGGAKGLAHIGILKAIDSAGLKIDYITGTSMGSIVGGLYALGYSADSIEKMARHLDWDGLLTNQTTLRSLIMNEKDEYGKYAIELPLQNGKFHLPTGVLESEEMWLKLNELFAPAYNISHFDHLSIPFRCIATKVSTGSAVVLDTGSLVTAIRASIAIPTLFTAVDLNGCSLVDGGIVRNFPVSDVRAMGADYVIGSSVSSGLLPQEKLTDAAQILMQVIFLEDGLQHREQARLCDIYIENPLYDYSTVSFNKSGEIIDLGMEQGRKLYPRFKHLVDSLDAVYGKSAPVVRRLPKVDSVLITEYEIKGLKRTDEKYFTRMMGFETGRYYDVTQLANRVRNIFGTRYYQRVLYTIKPLPDGNAKIVFDVYENDPTLAKLGLHYNSFSSISLITNLTTRNLFAPASRSLVTLALGENFRVRGEHLQQFGTKERLSITGSVQFETFAFKTYQKFTAEGLQRQYFFNGEIRLQFSGNRRFSTGIGWRYEWIKYRPSIQSQFDLKGSNRLHTAFVSAAFNSLDASVFPKKGVKVATEAGFVFRQNPQLVFLLNGEPAGNLDSLGIRYGNYARFTLNAEWYRSLSKRATLILKHRTGLNFNYRQNILNEFAIGGLTQQFRNQIAFAGLNEATVYTPSVAALQLGLRYKVSNNLYVTALSNGLIHNFVSRRKSLQAPDFLSGHALSLTYNTPVGPIEVSAMYSDQSGKVNTYVNIGLAF